MPAKLTLYPTEEASRHFVFREGRNHFVGRDPGSDIPLKDSRVSARHALFQWTGAGWILVDLRSKNGTFVNGARVTEIPLQNKDWINFGGLLGRYERLSEAEAEALHSERAARLQRFSQLCQDLDASLDPETLLRRLVETLLELTAAHRGFLLLWKPTGELEVEVASGFLAFEPLDERFARSFEAIERVLTTSHSVVTSKAKAEAPSGRRRTLAEMEIETLACVPLRADESVIGLIYVDSRSRGGVFTDLDLEILESMADHVVLLAGQLRSERQIRELVGAPSALASGANRNFLEELEERIGDLTRSARRTRTAPRLTPQR